MDLWFVELETCRAEGQKLEVLSSFEIDKMLGRIRSSGYEFWLMNLSIRNLKEKLMLSFNVIFRVK